MNTVSPYGPDRSLLLAIVVLLGGCLIGAGASYLVTTVAGDVSSWQQDRVAGTLEKQRLRASAHRSLRRSRSPAAPFAQNRPPRRTSFSPLAGGRVPAWVRSEASLPVLRSKGGRNLRTKTHPPARATYDLRADLSHAEIGASSPSSPDARSTAGATDAGAEGLIAGEAPLVADLGGVSTTDGSAGGGSKWRSELSRLNGRLRALNGAIAGLNQGKRGQAQGAESNQRTAARASARTESASGPDVPTDPDQVPVDGGLGWLAAAGAAYAVNRLRIQTDDEEG